MRMCAIASSQFPGYILSSPTCAATSGTVGSDPMFCGDRKRRALRHELKTGKRSNRAMSLQTSIIPIFGPSRVAVSGLKELVVCSNAKHQGCVEQLHHFLTAGKSGRKVDSCAERERYRAFIATRSISGGGASASGVCLSLRRLADREHVFAVASMLRAIVRPVGHQAPTLLHHVAPSISGFNLSATLCARASSSISFG